jgi:protease secretion system outer membrane protein
VIEAVDELENAKRKLESILGEPITDLRKVAKLQDKFSFLLVEPTTFEEWKERALANNAELAAMKNQVEVAKQEYAKNHGAHYPVVNLVAAATAQTSNTTATINQVANQSYAGFQVNLPLYAGGEINARSNQAYLNYQKTQSDYEVAKERVITELRKQYDLTRSGRLKIQALTEAKESSLKLVDAMRKSVRSGERINLDVLTADRTLFNSQQDLSQAKYVYLIAYIKLYQLGGSFDLTTLQKVASYFK